MSVTTPATPPSGRAVSARIALCVFVAYAGIYFIRSPVFAATFEGRSVFGGSYSLKSALALAQTLGYMVGKAPSIRYLPSLSRGRRLRVLLITSSLAEGFMLLFSVLPPEGQVAALFLAAVALSPVWAMLIQYMEGRGASEAIISGASFSFILAGGVARSLGAVALDFVSEDLMPGLVGALGLTLFVIFVSLVDREPDPSAADVAHREKRAPMDPAERNRLLREWWPGLLSLTVIYAALTGLRQYRDFFAAELWEELDPDYDASVFTITESAVATATLLCMASVTLIRANRTAFFAFLGAMLLGLVGIAAGTVLHQAGAISPVLWQITIGAGIFVAYTPPGALLYDRFFASIGQPTTTIALIFISDASGYVATIALLIYRGVGDSGDVVGFYEVLCLIAAAACIGLLTLAAAYFSARMRSQRYELVMVEEEAKGNQV